MHIHICVGMSMIYMCIWYTCMCGDVHMYMCRNEHDLHVHMCRDVHIHV